MAFGRFARPGAAEPMSEINVTPMVDVMLVLLVIFMVTAPWLGRALQLNLPPAQAAKTVSPAQALDIRLGADGRLTLNQEAVTWEDLPARLKVLTAGQQETPPSVRLAADAAVTYDQVVRMMDVLQQNGLGKIGLMTGPAQKP